VGGHDDNPSDATYLDTLNPVIAVAHLSADTSLLQPPNGSFEGEPKPSSPPTWSIKTAEECILSLCNIEYQVSFAKGAVSTHVVNTDFGSIEHYNGRFVGHNNSPLASCWQTQHQATDVGAFTNFRHGDRCFETFQPGHNNSFFCPLDLGYGKCGYYDGLNYGTSIKNHLSGSGTVVMAQDYVSDSIQYSSTVAQYIATNSLSTALSGVAASLSQLALADQHQPDALAGVAFTLPQSGTQNQTCTTHVHGTASVTETYVQIAWYWLVFPFAMDVCGAMFLLLATIQSRRKGLRPWKSSVLPLLYHGLEANMSSRRPVSEDVSMMAKVAEDTEVRLAYSNRRAKTMLKQS
jgi:hypothetical protein